VRTALAFAAGNVRAQNFKAATDKWPVAECVEHIAAAEDFIRGMAVTRL